MRKQKAPKLVISTRQSIGRYKKNNPKATTNEIAAKFGCTAQQVRKAISDFNQGLLSKPKSNNKAQDVGELLNRPADELLEEQYHYSIAQVSADKKLGTDVRVQMLKDIFGMRKIIQSLRLESHLKRTDAVILGIIIRRFLPQATDDDIIAIYNESLAIYRGGQ